MAFVKVATLDELWSGEKLGRVAHGRGILLVNLEGSVRAYEDRCAHKGVPLSEGRLEGRVLTCSAHAWEYDACTGEGLNPRSAALRRLSVKVEGEDILVDVEPERTAGEPGHAGQTGSGGAGANRGCS